MIRCHFLFYCSNSILASLFSNLLVLIQGKFNNIATPPEMYGIIRNIGATLSDQVSDEVTHVVCESVDGMFVCVCGVTT